MVSSSLEILRDWDVVAFETFDYTLNGAQSVVVLWSEPTNVDEGPSQRLAGLLAEGLASCGRVAFRSFEPAPPSSRLVGRIGSKRDGWDVVVAQEHDAVAELFGIGWGLRWQAGLIGANDMRAFDLLADTFWRDHKLCTGEVAVTPIVDGDGMMVSAPTVAELEAALVTILRPAIEQGYSVQDTSMG